MGEQRKSHKLRIGRYAQHFVDALQMDDTPVEYLERRFPEVRAVAAAVVFSTELGQFCTTLMRRSRWTTYRPVQCSVHRSPWVTGLRGLIYQGCRHMQLRAKQHCQDPSVLI